MAPAIEYQKQMTEIVYINLPGPKEPDPGMSGGETFDRLKQINPNVRVLLSSGYSLEGQAQDILNRGCLGFIQKPYKIEELAEKIRDIVS